MHPAIRGLAIAALLVWSTMASAVVYRWVDAQGKVQYGDRPPDGVKAEVVPLLGVHSSSSTPAQAAPNPSTARTQPSGGKPLPAAADKTREAVAEDVAATREKQCAEAQDRYKKLIEGRRLYKTGENGEREFLTSDEIDTARINAKQELDAVCNPGN
jgi:hypothetical protein